jgi:hypothetical protein
MTLTQELGQRVHLELVNAEADERVLVLIKDWDQHERIGLLLTLLRLVAAPLHLVAGPVQLFQAELAAEEVGRDDDEHDAGTAQGGLHLRCRMIAVPADRARRADMPSAQGMYT